MSLFFHSSASSLSRYRYDARQRPRLPAERLAIDALEHGTAFEDADDRDWPEIPSLGKAARLGQQEARMDCNSQGN